MSRITPGIMLILVFAILCGLAGAFVIKRELTRVTPTPAQAAAKEVPTYVPLASRELEPGRVITEGDFLRMSFTKADLAKQKFPPFVMADAKQIMGRTLRDPIKKGQPFVVGCFYPDGTGPDLTERLKPGLRAVTISVSGASALAQQAVPGAMVDVIFRTKLDEEQSIPETTALLIRNVEILALGKNSTPGLLGGIDAESETNPITLAVTTEQANHLKVAEGHGELSLVLRASGDVSQSNDNGPLTLRELLNLPPAVPKSRTFVAEIYRGGKRQTLTFQRDRVAQETFGGVPHRPDNAVPDAPRDDTSAPDSQPSKPKPPNNPLFPPSRNAAVPTNDT